MRCGVAWFGGVPICALCCLPVPGTKKTRKTRSEGREIRTPNLLIWSQTRYRCAIAPMRLSSSVIHAVSGAKTLVLTTAGPPKTQTQQRAQPRRQWPQTPPRPEGPSSRRTQLDLDPAPEDPGPEDSPGSLFLSAASAVAHDCLCWAGCVISMCVGGLPPVRDVLTREQSVSQQCSG